jgi:PEP-CTERM motif
MKTRSRSRKVLRLLPFTALLLVARAGAAATYHTVATFPADENPGGGVTAVGSLLYAATGDGGTHHAGSIVSVNLDGSNFQTLHSFTSVASSSGLIVDGNTIYGATGLGGVNNNGTVFSMSTSGSGFQVLRDFTGGSDSGPGALIEIGSSLFGLDNDGLFSIGTGGANFQVLHAFGGGPTNGFLPGAITEYNGQILGPMVGGAANNAGGIYTMDTDGSNFQIIFSMPAGDPGPTNVLVPLGTTLFGVTSALFSQTTAVFSVNADGTGLTPLHLFSGGTLGAPGALTIVGNRIYGLTPQSIFSMDLNGGNFQTIKSGITPTSSLLLVGDQLYGFARDGPTVLYAITVPEPSTLALGAIALGTLFVAGVRSKAARAWRCHSGRKRPR